MKAAWYEHKGAAREVLQTGEMPAPVPEAGEVLVKIHASGVNPSDTKSRSGWNGNPKMPFERVIPNQDGSGLIEAVGEGVPIGRIGERVWVYEAQWNRPFGTGAEYATVLTENAVRLPENTSFVEGACLGIPAMTAHRALFQDGSIAGKNILVTGGAGAVSFYAVQLARWGKAARVIATVSSDEQARLVAAAGADAVINRKTENVADRVFELTSDGVDRVIDVAFGENLEITASVIKPNGVISSYASDSTPEPTFPFYPLSSKNVTVHCVLVYVMPQDAHLKAASEISACLEENVLKHPKITRFKLEEIAAAHEAVEAGRSNGRSIVTI